MMWADKARLAVGIISIYPRGVGCGWDQSKQVKSSNWEIVQFVHKGFVNIFSN